MSDAWSTSLLASKAPADVVRRNRDRSTKERHAAEMEAYAFLTTEHDAYEGELTRDYDPFDLNGTYDPHAMPTPEADYVGTGIGALYGLGMESDSIVHDREGNETVSRRSFAPDLAGWNVRRER